MFNEATFREILVPSSGNVNDYVKQIYRKDAELDGNNVVEFVDVDGKKLRKSTN